MILVSTHRKLVEKGAVVHRVDWPEMTVIGTTIPAHHEHFATIKQATDASINRYPRHFGQVSQVDAADFDAWADR